jgi:hypothetical protein
MWKPPTAYFDSLRPLTFNEEDFMLYSLVPKIVTWVFALFEWAKKITPLFALDGWGALLCIGKFKF